MNNNELKKFLEKLAIDNNYSNVFILGFTQDENKSHDFMHLSRDGYPDVFRQIFQMWFNENCDAFYDYAKEKGGDNLEFNSFIDGMRREPVAYKQEEEILKYIEHKDFNIRYIKNNKGDGVDCIYSLNGREYKKEYSRTAFEFLRIMEINRHDEFLKYLDKECEEAMKHINEMIISNTKDYIEKTLLED